MDVKITHYEDEIRKQISGIEIINGKNYKKDKDNKWSPEEEKWMNSSDEEEFYCNLMSLYLQKKIIITKKRTKKGHQVFPYLDIDDTESPKSCSYYSDLTYYLNKRVDAFKKSSKIENYIFLQPGEAKYKYGVGGAYDYRIALIKDNAAMFPLKSDTFGFSVSFEPKYLLKYPYGIYFNYINTNTELTDKEKKNEYMFIGECVYDTRTIGGAFIWPIYKLGKKTDTLYNIIRGNNSYIEDRVDLTLLEIKHMLSDNPREYSRDILHGEYEKTKSHMEDWLDVFKTFDKYVELLIFHPFVVKKNNVNEYVPIDIINSKIEEGEENGFVLKGDIHCLNDCETGWGIKKGIIRDDNTTDKEKMKKLKQMLNNVRLLTLARSQMMEKVIKTEGNPWKKETIPQWKKENNEWIFKITD